MNDYLTKLCIFMKKKIVIYFFVDISRIFHPYDVHETLKRYKFTYKFLSSYSNMFNLNDNVFSKIK